MDHKEIANSLIIKNKSAEKLSKSQKLFNSSLKKISALKEEIESVKFQLNYVNVKISNDLIPLERKMLDKRIEMIRAYDQFYDMKYFTKKEKEKIAKMLEILFESIPFDLVEEDESLLAIYHKYFEQEEEEEMEEDNLFDFIFGQGTGKKFKNVFEGFEKGFAGEEEEFSNPGKAKKKTKAQEAKEEKEKNEKAMMNKTSRSIYTELVKIYHPDREQDEQERERKTRIMHEITEAYEKDDLYSLLRLQQQYGTIKEQSLEELEDIQLNHYIKLFKKQISELQEQLYRLKIGRTPFSSSLYHEFCHPNEKIMDKKLKTAENKLKKEVKEIERELSMNADKVSFKTFLKSLEFEEEDDFFFDFPFKL